MKKPTPILLDSFTDTDGTALTAHTGDTANTWVASTANTGTALSISGNQLSIASLNGGYHTGSSLSDVTVMLDNSPQATAPIGVGPLLGAAANVSAGSYIGIYFSGNWYLFKGGSSGFQSLASVSIGAEFPATDTAADQYSMRLIRRTASGVATLNLIVNGRQVISVTDSSPLTGSPGMYSNNTGSGTMDNFRVFPASSEIGVAMIGDSITLGAFITTPPDVYFGAALTRGKSGLPMVVYNYGISGTTSADWVNSTNGASLSSAITSLQNQNTRVASIMLGVNDAKTAGRISIAAHKTNIASICRTLNAAGITVMLNRPTYVVPGSSTNAWDTAASATYLPGYWEAQQSLVNGAGILQGDTQGFDMIATDPTNRTSDGVHPVQAFSRILFQMHANALLGLFSSAVSAGRINVNINVDGGLF